MKKAVVICFLLLVLVSLSVIAQPYADIIGFNCQTFSSDYKSNTARKNKTDDYFLNFFVPKEFKNGNTLLVRVNSELMSSTLTPDSSYSSTLYSVSLPLGMQFVSKSKKWKTVLIVLPKIASDFKDALDAYDYQFGGIFLENYQHSETFKVKFGAYFNREAFGNFFMPIIGLDWKVNDRLYMYGNMPNFYRIEYALKRNKLYGGLGFRSLTRSFRLSKADNYDYVRYNEIQLKLFVDYFVAKKILVFAEVGYSLGQNPWQFTYSTKDETFRNPIYTPLNPYPVFNAGFAYRVRFDLTEKLPE
jgi:hypothetical protein